MTKKQFLANLEREFNNRGAYCWGTDGQMIPEVNEAFIRRKENSVENANRAIAFMKKRVAEGYAAVMRFFDCSGLGTFCLGRSKAKANTMMGWTKKIDRADLEPGDWVFSVYAADKFDANGKRTQRKGEAYHIGYVVDAALNVIECKGRDDGVVKRALNASGTSYWGRCGRPNVYDDAAPATNPYTVQYVRVIGAKVNIRTEPHKDGGDAGTAIKGNEFLLVKPAPTGWYEIVLPDGTHAYISNRPDLTEVVERPRDLMLTDPFTKGEDVRDIQLRLAEVGCNPGKADGSYGPQTVAAVKEFQRRVGAPVTGAVDGPTRAKLGTD